MDKDISIVRQTGGQVTSTNATLEKVKTISIEKLLVNFDLMFANTDDLLFDMATQAQSNNEQNTYFESMREVSTKRAILKSSFQLALAKSFKEPDISDASAAHSKSAPTSQPVTLSLVDNEGLEKKIGLTNIITKARSEHAMALLGLNARLDILYKDYDIVQENSPLDPAQICQAFSGATDSLEIQIKPLMILLKQFERFVISELDLIYEEINQLLINAGVLSDFTLSDSLDGRGKQIEHGQPESAQDTDEQGDALDTQTTAGNNNLSGARRASPQSAQNASPHEVQSNANSNFQDQAGQASSELAQKSRRYSDVQRAAEATFKELKNLLTILRDDGNYQDYYAANRGPVLQPNQLMTVLGELDTEHGNLAGATPQDPNVPLEAAPIKLREAVQNILERRATGQESPQAVSRDDSDTIHLVEMLFSFILDEAQLPVQIQAQLSLLQIPVLKIALIDKTIFQSHNHPVRRLLNKIAGTAIGWNDKNISKDKLFNKIVTIVEQARENQNPTKEFYDELCHEFDEFTEKLATKSNLIEKRVCQEAYGNARFQESANLIDLRLGQLLDEKVIPTIVINLLTKEWRQYLQMVSLKSGPDGIDTQTAWQFVTDLLWSVQQHEDEKSNRRLATLAPKLQKQMEENLGKFLDSQIDVEKRVSEITFIHELILSNRFDATLVETKKYEHPKAPVEDAENLDGAITEPSAEPSSDSEADPKAPKRKISAVERQRIKQREEVGIYLDKVNELKIGTWLEFHLSNDSIVRGKLAAKIPVTDTYVMVNRMGVKAVEIKRAALAYDLQRGKVLILDGSPIFDQALSSITHRLRKVKTQSGELV